MLIIAISQSKSFTFQKTEAIIYGQRETIRKNKRIDKKVA